MSNELGCPKCESSEVDEDIVDYRLMFQCRACASIWYAPRIATDPYTVIVDGITSEVDKHGYCLMELAHLSKSAFKEERGAPSTMDQVKFWARQNKLIVDFEKGIAYFIR
jgi:hypothetical protein